jgi:hypothetical protein
MQTILPDHSYIALRAQPHEEAPEWWAAAHARGDAPTPIRGLLAGRTHVELSEQEARSALSWASRLEGWNEPAVRPVFRYPETSTP